MRTSPIVSGATVWIRSRRWRVDRASREGGVTRLDVREGGQHATFLAPFDRCTTVGDACRVRHVRRQHARARLLQLIAGRERDGALSTVLAADMALLPHQLEPASAIATGVRRVLIADQAGLGKTIQACVILGELARERPAFRAIVLAPASLVTQWQEELASRFHLQARVASHETLARGTVGRRLDENPWAGSCLWISSFDYLKQPHVLAGLPQLPWDIVVIDEAHDVCGESERHAASHALAARSRHVVLLSATPHSGDSARFQRLVDLGRLGTGPDEELVVFRRTRHEVGLPAMRRARWQTVRLSAAETRALDALVRFERAVLQTAGTRHRIAALLLLSVFRKRALSTMTALSISLKRRLAWLDAGQVADFQDWRQPSLFAGNEPDDLGDEEGNALSADVGTTRSHERAMVRRLLDICRIAARHERKVERLRDLLRRAQEPVVVFTEFRHTLLRLETVLGHDHRVAVMHGGQSSAERQRSLRAFTRGDASVLLATDVAGQGLNLQSRCRWIISFELPWNPARLEQRIGRVDRIGQLRPVHATMLMAAHPAEAGLLKHLARRVVEARFVMGQDALDSAAPPDAAEMADALVGGGADSPPLPHSPDRPPTAPIKRSTRWSRRARATARVLAARRILMTHWQHAELPRRPVWTALRAVAAVSGPIAVVTVPLLDGNGRVVENVLAAVRLPGFGRRRLTAADITSVYRALSERVNARLKRLKRRAVARATARTAIEERLASHVLTTLVPRNVQSGLFDRAVERARLRALEYGQVVHESLAAASAGHARAADIAAGTPVLELLLVRRP